MWGGAVRHNGTRRLLQRRHHRHHAGDKACSRCTLRTKAALTPEPLGRIARSAAWFVGSNPGAWTSVRCAWDALAEKPENVAGNRGNFTLALQAAVLLEWVCRLCICDSTGQALHDFTTELQKIEPKYCTELDGRCSALNEFSLPGVGPDPQKSLLGAVWDLIRNGQAHQYHDLIVNLQGGTQWVLGLQGARYGWPLSKVATSGSLRPPPSSSSRAGCPSPAIHPVRALRCELAACRRHPALASPWRGHQRARWQQGGLG
jgi:hypothetical protein